MIRIDTSQSERKGIVIMVHGWAQNAKVFMNKTLKLTKKLKNAGYDVILLDAPHVMPMKSIVDVEGQQVEISNGGRANARAWFTYNPNDPSDANEAQSGKIIPYIGIEESLDVVANSISSTIDYSREKEHEVLAIFGFSQGGTFAEILASLAAAGAAGKGDAETKAKVDPLSEPFRRIDCAICVGAFSATHSSETKPSKYDLHTTIPINMPSLHIIGKNDTSVHPDKSRDLSNKFINAETYEHDKGHLVPTNSASCAEIISFLERQRGKGLRSE